MAIKRLSCRKDEVYTSLFPEEIAFDYTVDATPIFACKFAIMQGYEHLLALANEEGRISIHNTESNSSRYGGGAHSNAVFDLAWLPRRLKFVSAAGDHSATLFNVGNGSIVPEKVFRGHTRSLKTVACRTDDSSVFASGGRDGKIIVWDPRASKSDVVDIPDISLPFSHVFQNSQIKGLKNAPPVSASSSVTGLVFQDTDTLISCGSGDGIIKVWDMRKTYCISNKEPISKYRLPYGGTTSRFGFSNLLVDSSSTKLYANCVDNVIYCYNIATYCEEPIMKYVGHKNSTYYVKASLSADDKYLFSGSSDNNAYIWNIKHSEPLVRLEGHEAEVTCVAWSGKRNSTTLVTCSDDLKHKLWRVGPEILPKSCDSEYSSCAVTIQHNTCNQDPFTSQNLKRLHENDENAPNEFINLKRSRKDEVNSRKRRLFSTIDENACEEEEEEDVLVKRLKMDTQDDSDTESVISNLPNFVMDGSAPHLVYSPIKEIEKDWLTKLRLKRSSSTDMRELNPLSPKMAKLEVTRRRLSATGIDGRSPKSRKTLHMSPAKSPLLKFFKFTNNTSTSQQCLTKSPNLIASPLPQSLQ